MTADGPAYRTKVGATPVPRAAAAAFSAALVAAALYLTAQATSIAADGAYFLLRIIDDGSLHGQSTRSFALAVRQAPTLVGVWLGTTDTYLLAVLLGVGQLVLPALIWIAALLLARRDTVVFCSVLLTASICWATTALFSVGELSFAMPLALLVAVLLWLPAPWAARHAVAAAVAAFLLTRSHEASLFLAGVLVPWAGVRAYAAGGRLERIACGLVAVSGVATIAIAVPEIRRREDDPSAANLASSVVHLLPIEIYALLVVAVCVLVVSFVPVGRAARLAAVGLGALGGVVALYGLFATRGDAYSGRGGALLVAWLCVVLLLGLWNGRRLGRSAGPVAPAPAAVWVCVAVACVPLAAVVLRAETWGDSLAAFRTAVVTREGLVPAASVVPSDSPVLWNATAPTLSLLVRSQPGDAILLDGEGILQPFPAARAREHLADRYTWRQR